MPGVGFIAAATGATSLLLTKAIQRFALTNGLLDVPNERSAHTLPTPRGGGGAIVLAATAGFAVLGTLHALDGALLVALVGGGLAVAIVGLIDDRHPLPALLRLLVHFLVAAWAIAWVGGLPALEIAGRVLLPASVCTIFAAVGIVWVLNLFNFMDGIDGIAASEAIFITWAAAAIAHATNSGSGVAAAALVLGAASLGFLVWNWSPARIFMGDIGSGYLGYVIAVLALADAQHSAAALLMWLTLGGVFFVDATTTLARRLTRGERVYQAHRSHAYQRLARRWRSHGWTTTAVVALNVLWLLPCAWYVGSHPAHALLGLIAGLAPIAALAWVLGAGVRE